MKFEWKIVNLIEDGEYFWECTSVAKVHGGWISRSIRETSIEPEGNIFRDKCVTSESSVFIPDPNHEWDISEYKGS